MPASIYSDRCNIDIVANFLKKCRCGPCDKRRNLFFLSTRLQGEYVLRFILIASFMLCTTRLESSDICQRQLDSLCQNLFWSRLFYLA